MHAKPADLVDLTVTAFLPGLTGTIGFRVLKPDGSVVAARSTDVAELATGSGTYGARITAPATVGRYLVLWDDGQVAPGHVAIDYLDVTLEGDELVFEPGQPVTLFAAAFQPGQAAALGVTVTNADGWGIRARSGAGISELITGSGIYHVDLPGPPLPGSYTVAWDDGAGHTAAEQVTIGYTAAAFAPSVADVGRHLRVRTRDANGNELGTFTAATRPTDDQVRGLIESATSKVTSKIGTQIAPALWEKATTTIALRAAMLVELSFFGDQIAAGRSPFNELKTLHDEEWTDLYADWRALGADLIPGTADDVSEAGLPVYSFPPLAGMAHVPGSELPYDGGRLDW